MFHLNPGGLGFI